MHFHKAYGLVLDSELELPELPSSSKTPADILLRLGDISFTPPDTSRVICRPLSKDDFILHFKGVGAALIHQGKEITLQPARNAKPLPLRLFIIQQVLGVTSLWRGCLVLHASAVVKDGKAVCFVGAAGKGKSTMAAAMNQMNCPILTDDVLVIDPSNQAHPGLVRLKLTPETKRQLALETSDVQPIGEHKTLCATIGAVAKDPVSLEAIYLLENGPDTNFLPVPPAKAAIELVRQTYGADLLPHLGKSVTHFQQCIQLAKRIPVTVLTRPRDLSLLPQITEQVMARG